MNEFPDKNESLQDKKDDLKDWENETKQSIRNQVVWIRRVRWHDKNDHDVL